MRVRDMRTLLTEHFGHTDFLPGQEEVIAKILDGRDVLAIMPTGGGKSLCYQLSALLLEGITLVVSPLVALMKDQVDALAKKERFEATHISSLLNSREQKRRIERLVKRQYKLVYVAPERFRSQTEPDKTVPRHTTPPGSAAACVSTASVHQSTTGIDPCRSSPALLTEIIQIVQE